MRWKWHSSGFFMAGPNVLQVMNKWNTPFSTKSVCQRSIPRCARVNIASFLWNVKRKPCFWAVIGKPRCPLFWCYSECFFFGFQLFLAASPKLLYKLHSILPQVNHWCQGFTDQASINLKIENLAEWWDFFFCEKLFRSQVKLDTSLI